MIFLPVKNKQDSTPPPPPLPPPAFVFLLQMIVLLFLTSKEITADFPWQYKVFGIFIAPPSLTLNERKKGWVMHELKLNLEMSRKWSEPLPEPQPESVRLPYLLLCCMRRGEWRLDHEKERENGRGSALRHSTCWPEWSNCILQLWAFLLSYE